MKHYNNFRDSIILFQELLARLMEFPLPTMCVYNGTAIAGGYIMGLAHDFRVMHESNGIICLSELKLGLALPPPYMGVVAAKLPARVACKISFAVTIN
jgi:enoyl-CoA hydratase/carnithine racemase